MAKQREKATQREWLHIAGIALAVAGLAIGIGWVSTDSLGGLVFVAGHGWVLTRALGLISRVGPAKPFALDQRGLSFDGALLFPLATIWSFEILGTSQAQSVEGVHTRAFAGGMKVVATAGRTWFELSVPDELVRLARTLRIHVIDSRVPNRPTMRKTQ